MRRALLAALLLAVALAPAVAQTPEMVAPASECPQPDAYRSCEQTRETLPGDIARAWKGDYQGQRNVAFCLLTGCDDSIRVDRLTGCAWRIVIVQSGASEVDQSDTLNLDVNCAAKLSRTEKQAAVAKAATIYKKVYGRAAPKFAW